MRKVSELLGGCMSKALPQEMTFVLLSRDAAAPATIRAWISERVRLGKNNWGDEQLIEAEQCAATMEREGKPAPPVVEKPAAIFTRPECTFVFCPHPHHCKGFCLNERR